MSAGRDLWGGAADGGPLPLRPTQTPVFWDKNSFGDFKGRGEEGWAARPEKELGVWILELQRVEA